MVQNKNHTRKEADGLEGFEKGDKNQYETNTCKEARQALSSRPLSH